jgi:dynein heavy chain
MYSNIQNFNCGILINQRKIGNINVLLKPVSNVYLGGISSRKSSSKRSRSKSTNGLSSCRMKITERSQKTSSIELIIFQDFLEFLEKRDRVWIGVLLLQSGQLATVFEPPSTSKNKGVFFFKREEEPVPKEDIKNLVTFGDLSALPLDQFGAFVDDIMDDILVHQDMATGWPKVVSGDVQSSMNKLKSEVYEITGSMKGRTLLPMPAGIEQIENDAQVREVMGVIEGIVIKWAHQIKAVLDLKSSQAMLDGLFPTPHEELRFWADLTSNLQCIYDQLTSPKVCVFDKALKTKLFRYEK